MRPNVGSVQNLDPLMDPLWTPLWTPNLDPPRQILNPQPKINPTLTFGPYPPPSNLDLQ
jgi:hypothetical protein